MGRRPACFVLAVGVIGALFAGQSLLQPASTLGESSSNVFLAAAPLPAPAVSVAATRQLPPLQSPPASVEPATPARAGGEAAAAEPAAPARAAGEAAAAEPADPALAGGKAAAAAAEPADSAPAGGEAAAAEPAAPAPAGGEAAAAEPANPAPAGGEAAPAPAPAGAAEQLSPAPSPPALPPAEAEPEGEQTPAVAGQPPTAAVAAHVAHLVPQLPPKRPSSPEVAPDLFPEPILFDLLGEELARPNCTGSEAEVESCCIAACKKSRSCEFWVMDSNSGPCRLKRNYKGLAPTTPGGRRGMFKASASLKMSDVLPARPLEEDLAQLREELARPCPQAHWTEPNSNNASRIKAWVQWALKQVDGQVQAFPEHDILLSSKTCIDRKLQFAQAFPFYLLKQSPEGTPEAIPPPDLRETWRVEDAFVPVNFYAFQMVHKPGCRFGHPIWTYKTERPPLSEFRGFPWEMRLAPIRDAAVANSDVWSNIGHALQQIFFLGPAMEADYLKLPNQTVEMVPVQHSFFFRFLSPLFQLLFEAQGVGKAVKEQVRFLDPNNMPPPRCYNLVAQRFRTWPRSPLQHRRDTLRYCGIRDRGLRPKMLLWYKKNAGHNLFANHDWVVGSIKRWVSTTDFHIEAKELSTQEVDNMTACEQIALFADLALYVGVHGAAGIHNLWLPPGAVYMEIAPEGRMNSAPRTSSDGYYSEPTAMGGRLYLRYQHAVPLRYIALGQIYNKYLAIDPRELVAVLQVLYTEWIRPRVGASIYGADAPP